MCMIMTGVLCSSASCKCLLLTSRKLTLPWPGVVSNISVSIPVRSWSLLLFVQFRGPCYVNVLYLLPQKYILHQAILTLFNISCYCVFACIWYFEVAMLGLNLCISIFHCIVNYWLHVGPGVKPAEQRTLEYLEEVAVATAQ